MTAIVFSDTTVWALTQDGITFQSKPSAPGDPSNAETYSPVTFYTTVPTSPTTAASSTTQTSNAQTVNTPTSALRTSSESSSTPAFSAPVANTLIADTSTSEAQQTPEITSASSTSTSATRTVIANPPTTHSTASPSSTHTPATSSKSSGKTNNVAIIVPVVLAILLLLAAGIFALWYLKRRKRHQNPGRVTPDDVHHFSPGPARPVTPEKPTSINPFSTPTVFPNIEERRSLDELKDGFTDPVNGLFDLIASHVDKYYETTAQIPWHTLTAHQNQRLAFLKAPYFTELPDSLTSTLMKHALAYAIISRIDFHTNLDKHIDRPLLPRLILNSYRQKDKTKRATFLQQHKDSSPQFIKEQDNRAEGVADACAIALQPWSLNDELAPRTREDDMVALMKYAQGLGLRLFEAQETLKWDWDGPNEDAAEGEVVVQPGLMLKVDRGSGSGSSSAGSPRTGKWEEVVPGKVQKI